MSVNTRWWLPSCGRITVSTIQYCFNTAVYETTVRGRGGAREATGSLLLSRLYWSSIKHPDVTRNHQPVGLLCCPFEKSFAVCREHAPELFRELAFHLFGQRNPPQTRTRCAVS